MNGFLEVLKTLEAPGLIIVVALIIMASGFKKGWIGQFVTALNSLNTPWVAFVVIIAGMIYNLKCKTYGIPSDSANQVIGGGIGLLTGQALGKRDNTALIPPLVAMPDPPPTPIAPVEPAKEG